MTPAVGGASGDAVTIEPACGIVAELRAGEQFRIVDLEGEQVSDLVVFLLCDQCGTVGEASSAEVASNLKAAARSAGFTPRSPVIEISGVCSHCGGSA